MRFCSFLFVIVFFLLHLLFLFLSFIYGLWCVGFSGLPIAKHRNIETSIVTNQLRLDDMHISINRTIHTTNRRSEYVYDAGANDEQQSECVFSARWKCSSRNDVLNADVCCVSTLSFTRLPSLRIHCAYFCYIGCDVHTDRFSYLLRYVYAWYRLCLLLSIQNSRLSIILSINIFNWQCCAYVAHIHTTGDT